MKKNNKFRALSAIYTVFLAVWVLYTDLEGKEYFYLILGSFYFAYPSIAVLLNVGIKKFIICFIYICSIILISETSRIVAEPLNLALAISSGLGGFAYFYLCAHMYTSKRAEKSVPENIGIAVVFLFSIIGNFFIRGDVEKKSL